MAVLEPPRDPGATLESLIATTSVDRAHSAAMEERIMADLNSSVWASETVPDPMTTLMPALLQIFTTIGLGWVAGALKIFGPHTLLLLD